MFGDIYDNFNEYNSESHIPGIITLAAQEFFKQKKENIENN